MQISPIRSDGSNAFAHDTFAKRLPQIIRDIQANNNFSASINNALDDLHEQLVNDAPLPPPPLSAPDAQTWLDAYEQHKGESWQNTEWFFAETYFFHLVNEIVKYWQSGFDPYRQQKNSEVFSDSFRNKRSSLAAFEGTPFESLHELIGLSLWGNRVDLSLPEVMKTQTQESSAEDLLVNERPHAIKRILESKGAVHLITDNFGTELMMDLALADALLQLSIPVTFHIKMNPTYVSDVHSIDIRWLLYVMHNGGVRIAGRLDDALDAGFFQIAPNFFWNSPHFLNKLPSHLMQLFNDARLIILKGDANYRRAFYDTIWPVDMPTTEIVNYLPAPLLCLRTLKSDCLAGVPRDLAERAEAANPQWRTLGKYGLIQYIE